MQAAAPALAAAGGRALALADWHVTLCFLGAVEPPLIATLEAAAEQIDAAAEFGFLAQIDQPAVLTRSMMHFGVMPRPLSLASIAEG